MSSSVKNKVAEAIRLVFGQISGSLLRQVSPDLLGELLAVSSYVICKRILEPVIVERKEKQTIFHIQNLNVYLTADYVQQLNVNPEKVMNLIQDRLMAELNHLETTKNQSKNEGKK